MPVDPYFTGPSPTDTWTPPDVAIADSGIPGPHGPVPLRTYRPRGDTRGALLWAHGGGFRHGDLDMYEAHMLAAELAHRAGVFVASVDYRLAGDTVRYPVPVDDVHAAWIWLCRTESGPVSLGGASAGGALALATALRARDRAEPTPAALLLAYPFLHYPVPALDPKVCTEMTAASRFTALSVEDMVRAYVGRISDIPPEALPGAANLEKLPPTYLVVAEYDDLRASAELLARQLGDLAVPVESYLARGMTHGHLNHPPVLPQMQESLDFFARALRGCWGTS